MWSQPGSAVAESSRHLTKWPEVLHAPAMLQHSCCQWVLKLSFHLVLDAWTSSKLRGAHIPLLTKNISFSPWISSFFPAAHQIAIEFMAFKSAPKIAPSRLASCNPRQPFTNLLALVSSCFSYPVDTGILRHSPSLSCPWTLEKCLLLHATLLARSLWSIADLVFLLEIPHWAKAAKPDERKALRSTVETHFGQTLSSKLFTQTAFLVMIAATPVTIIVGTRIHRHQPLTTISKSILKTLPPSICPSSL